jgi:hypothetical protein
MKIAADDSKMATIDQRCPPMFARQSPMKIGLHGARCAGQGQPALIGTG